MTAAPSIDDILARVPQLDEHTVAPPALTPLNDSRSLQRELLAAIESTPLDARGPAALGNLLSRQSLYLAARDAYVRAITLENHFSQAHVAIAELSCMLRDGATASAHLTQALALRRRYDDPRPVAGRVRVLMLLRDAAYSVNAPLEMLLDRERVALHKLYVGSMPLESLPEFDVAFCAFGPISGEDRAIENARAIAGEAVVINAPQSLDASARHNLGQTLRNCARAKAVEARLIRADEIAGVALPALVRPADTQAGFGLARVTTHDDLAAHVERFPAQYYAVSSFFDYRSPDGFFRKYRVMLVDGVAYPYHLAISPRWMVHYQGSPMQQYAWMREEEGAFLADPTSVFPDWHGVTRSISASLGVDYIGLDVARLSDGTMLVFEADPAMLVHDEDEDGSFAYKRPYVAAIREALHTAIAKRVSRELRSSAETT